MEGNAEIDKTLPVANVTTDREACSKIWYAAHVRSCCEKRVAQKLDALGVETFVPTRKEVRQWSDRKKKVEIVLIPMVVFLHIEPEKLLEIQQLSFIFGLLKVPGQKRPAQIPSNQIERLKFMVGYSKGCVEFIPQDFYVGDYVIICRGGLKGLSGFVKENTKGKTKIGVIIDYLGCATVEVSKTDIHKIKNNSYDNVQPGTRL